METKEELFKQLQRAKAELEQFKKDIKAVFGCINCKKELENDTLHITIEKLKGDLFIAEDSLRDYQEHYNKLENENEKLKNAKATDYIEFKQHLKVENEKLKVENEKLKEKKDKYYQNNLTYERQISELIQVLEYIRDLNNKTVQIPIITDKINEVLND